MNLYISILDSGALCGYVFSSGLLFFDIVICPKYSRIGMFFDLGEFDAMDPMICGNEDGDIINPVIYGGLMLILMALGLVMATLMVPVMANHPCRVAMPMIMVMFMTMVMAYHLLFDLWGLYSYIPCDL